MILFVLIFRIKKGTLQCVSLKEIISHDYWEFNKMGLKIVGAIYAEFLGFEANTYFSGITHDQDQISAFVSWVNITGILFTVGLGFGNVVRVNVSNYVGEGKHAQAKNASLFYTVMAAIFGGILMILISVFPYAIASVYTPLKSVTAWLVPILYVFSIGAL